MRLENVGNCVNVGTTGLDGVGLDCDVAWSMVLAVTLRAEWCFGIGIDLGPNNVHHFAKEVDVELSTK